MTIYLLMVFKNLATLVRHLRVKAVVYLFLEGRAIAVFKM